MFYLNLIPWMHLHRREVESFERDGSQVSIGLDGDCRIEIDEDKKTYRVAVAGAGVADEAGVFCPMDADRICFYSVAARELSAAWPASWKEADAAAVALSTGKRDPVTFKVQGGRVTVSVAAQQPVILYRDRKLARL